MHSATPAEIPNEPDPLSGTGPLGTQPMRACVAGQRASGICRAIPPDAASAAWTKGGGLYMRQNAVVLDEEDDLYIAESDHGIGSYLYSIDRDGNPRWRNEVDAVALRWHDGKLLVVDYGDSTDAYQQNDVRVGIRAFDANGNQLWVKTVDDLLPPEVTAGPSYPARFEGGGWIVDPEGRPTVNIVKEQCETWVVTIDPDTGAAVKADRAPVGCRVGSLFLASGVRLDMDTRYGAPAQTITAVSPDGAVAWTASATELRLAATTPDWILVWRREEGEPMRLVALDPATGAVARDLGLYYGGFGTVVASGDALWAQATGSTEPGAPYLVAVLDPKTLDERARVPMHGYALAVTDRDTAVVARSRDWEAHQPGAFTEISLSGGTTSHPAWLIGDDFMRFAHGRAFVFGESLSGARYFEAYDVH